MFEGQFIELSKALVMIDIYNKTHYDTSVKQEPFIET